ncbi:MAG TPA: transposase [Chitinophagaceae bacterium]|jgi:IS5 family transposase
MSFYSTFEEQLHHKHPLYILANHINWQQFDEAFKDFYYGDNGRPGKRVRLMVSLLMLSHIRNLSGESVVEQWVENAYYQSTYQAYGTNKTFYHLTLIWKV